MSQDAQTWVWPSKGIPLPPVSQTSNFGPINYGDSMVLNWTPATTPDVALYCLTESGGDTHLWASRGLEPPVTFTFNFTAKKSGNEGVFCHMTFLPSADGNTVVWQYIDDVESRNPTTFNADGAISPTTTRSGGKTETTASPVDTAIVTATRTLADPSTTSFSHHRDTRTGSSTDDASAPTSTAVNALATPPSSATTPSSTTSSTSSSPSSSLSAGASAGIGVGAALAILFLAALSFFFWRRRRRQTRNKGIKVDGNVFYLGDKSELDASTGLVEMDSRREPVELKADHGRSEMAVREREVHEMSA